MIDAMLFETAGSGVAASSATLFEIVPGLTGAVATIVTVDAAPFAKLGLVHTTS
jgi:hypothetical protein